jgi:hypothetical protein
VCRRKIDKQALDSEWDGAIGVHWGGFLFWLGFVPHVCNRWIFHSLIDRLVGQNARRPKKDSCCMQTPLASGGVHN